MTLTSFLTVTHSCDLKRVLTALEFSTVKVLFLVSSHCYKVLVLISRSWFWS